MTIDAHSVDRWSSWPVRRSTPTVERDELTDRLQTLRGDPDLPPEVSVVVPVNAQGDLDNVLDLIIDLTDSPHRHRIECILVINNYPADDPPDEIAEFTDLGFQVIPIPDVRRPGEPPGFSARVPGIRAAASSTVVLFDADCHLPRPADLIDWYANEFGLGAELAYTHVDYYDLKRKPSLIAYRYAHHLTRWFKRTVLGVPTNRGSNYAVAPNRFLAAYDSGLLADEMNVGPTFKAQGATIAYSGRRCHTVYTSGRMYGGGWLKIGRYLVYRLRYNIRVLPVGSNAAARTGRPTENRRYINNRPIR